MDDGEDLRSYVVVVNDEGQHSIWLAGRGVPAGWSTIGFEGDRQQCLDHIASVWTDMRPRSLTAAGC